MADFAQPLLGEREPPPAERRPHAAVIVEDDPDYVSPFGKDTTGHALYSALVTLTLGVLGSTVLPVPYAFSKTGVAAGVITMVLVAAANDATCCMMIRAAAHTGLTTYEQLAEWAGGRRARLFTQGALILLLFGTLCGGLAFLSDVARVMVNQGLGPGSAPPLLEQDGRPVMVLTVLLVLLPLCMQRHIRQFEKAATVGVVVVVALCGIIVARALQLRFPAVADGELQVLHVRLDGHLPEAFAVLGFAFYMQPMLMPLLREMPAGPLGTRLTERAVHITLFGVACGVYGTVGVFGAAIFGAATESNIMVNQLLPGHHTATLILYAALLGYLCCGMVTTHFALRASLDLLLAGPEAPFTWARQTAETLGILAGATCVALLFPTQAEKIFALTGCTAVCLVCYVIPVYIHLAVQRDADKQQLQLQLLKLQQGAAGAAVQPQQQQQQQQQQQRLVANGRLGSLADPILAPAGTAEGGEQPQQPPLLSCRNGGSGHGKGVKQVAGSSNGHCSSSSASSGGAVENSCSGGCCRCCRAVVAVVRRYALPAAIVAIGVGFSMAGIYVGVLDIWDYMHAGAGGQQPSPSSPESELGLPWLGGR
ncbi:hypothetical protein Agub_g10053 [Astrephomene gubernaculifera]|uniref:Amino acid transporter transmembrane domain-containing protein n=1 Tax=Astrephomene gubernaculifera TaxID=47775 RepID=A0AAD3DX65_9CHLO|nr:hypothetical protein Agub_g10053 [Astrephomene gubernaculifera]